MKKKKKRSTPPRCKFCGRFAGEWFLEQYGQCLACCDNVVIAIKKADEKASLDFMREEAKLDPTGPCVLALAPPLFLEIIRTFVGVGASKVRWSGEIVCYLSAPPAFFIAQVIHLATALLSDMIGYNMRKVSFANGEYYHVYNRGTEKRTIFPDKFYFSRFLQSMEEFNTVEPIGSIYANSFRKKELSNPVAKSKLVNFICFCLNPNHYHFILEQIVDRGVEKFMHKLGAGYTHYFNQKNERNGVLFQGPFKAKHINSNEYLLHLSAYVNLNNRVHQLSNGVAKSSWEDYLVSDKQISFCKKDVILSQFKTNKDYSDFAQDALEVIRRRKDMELLLLE